MTAPLARRTVLRAAAAAAVAGGTLAAGAGCGGDRPVQVAVVWSDEELRLFQRVMRGYPRPWRAISAGDDIDAFLRARRLAGTLPDVAILSRPGLIGEYAAAGWLTELDSAWSGRFPTALDGYVRHDGRLYGAWVKLAHKSLLWYLPELLPGGPPGSWPALVAVTAELGRRHLDGAGPAPLSVGAADGWVLTDWFENVLATTSGQDFYRRLAGGAGDWTAAPVRLALRRLAQVWGLPGAFPGGGPRALLTQYDESVIQVGARRWAAMVPGADFVARMDQDFDPAGSRLRHGRFPGEPKPLVVGGDAAVVLGGSRAGYDFVRALVDADFGPWIDAGGFLAARTAVQPDRYPDYRRQLAADIQDAAADLRFDLSDLLPAPLTGADGVGSWRIMQDFFAAVARGPHDGVAADPTTVDGAVDRAVRQLAAAAARVGRPT
ncbi:extracellular solute-binding protein [Plantactinospora siamensis]|uniref:Extracellular solute-binding protein n=1 Tax=Plantactinospora siamensis TaxID=555372 RepID=A0ABV6P2R8_9ACTN